MGHWWATRFSPARIPAIFVANRENESGREDLNLRLLGPEPSALPGCATPRMLPETGNSAPFMAAKGRFVNDNSLERTDEASSAGLT